MSARCTASASRLKSQATPASIIDALVAMARIRLRSSGIGGSAASRPNRRQVDRQKPPRHCGNQVRLGDSGKRRHKSWNRQDDPPGKSQLREGIIKEAIVIAGLRHDNVLHLAIVLGARLQRKPVPGTHGDHEILFVEDLFCEPGWHVVDGNCRDVDSASLKIGENRLPGVLERSPARARREKLSKADVKARSAMPHLGEQAGAGTPPRRHPARRW